MSVSLTYAYFTVINKHLLSMRLIVLIDVCALQDDKDLVHEFVNNDGLDCLIKVGSEADQNYQNYILRGIKAPQNTAASLVFHLTCIEIN